MLGLGQDFISKPNTVADFSLFFNIRLSILCKNLCFPSLFERYLFLSPPTTNKKTLAS